MEGVEGVEGVKVKGEGVSMPEPSAGTNMRASIKDVFGLIFMAAPSTSFVAQ